MKNILFLLMLAPLTALALPEDLHLIMTNGIAEKTVEPDMLVVSLESWAKAPSAAKAQEQQALQFIKIKTALEKFKIQKEDFQTENFSVTPEYFYDQKNQTNKIVGYRVSHTMKVVYRKVQEAGAFLDGLTASRAEIAGINVTGTAWDYEKKSELETAALADAVKNARLKAEEMAKAAEVIIKSVHRIQHTSYTAPPGRPMFEKASAMMGMSADGAAPASEISSGQIKVRVEVQMEFEI